MTVINPKSISGITSITLPSGGDNVLTIHTNDGTERFRIDSSGNVKVGSAATISPDGDVFFTGVCTATTLTGAASGLTGALPAIDGSALTGMASTENVRTGILDVAGISTFRNTMNVGAAVTISESGIEASGIGITCASINGTQIGGRRNLIINGAMEVAQRGTSSTSTGYQTIDRVRHYHNGTDEAPTYAQVDVASGTSPYTNGFRKAFKITNGNQTSGAGVSDSVEFVYFLEAQDLAKCGWNYTSSSSFVTLSFWIKSSVAQNFHGHLTTQDGTQQNYPYETGSLTADTWTKIVKTIPGNSNLQFDNDVNRGLSIKIVGFRGTSYTGSGSALNTWATYASGSRMPDNTSTWYTTNDATLEITGLQLEVGPQATAFEHRSFAEERELCRRYYHAIIGKMGSWGSAVAYNTTSAQGWMTFYPEMRIAPTFTWTGTLKLEDGAQGFTTSNTTAATTMGTHGFSWWTGGFSSLVDNNVYYVYDSAGTGYFQLDAEL